MNTRVKGKSRMHVFRCTERIQDSNTLFLLNSVTDHKDENHLMTLIDKRPICLLFGHFYDTLGAPAVNNSVPVTVQ